MTEKACRVINFLMQLSVAAYLAAVCMLAGTVWDGTTIIRILCAVIATVYTVIMLTALVFIRKLLRLKHSRECMDELKEQLK